MSLRRRIVGVTVLVVVLSVVSSVAVGYSGTQARLGAFVDEIGDDEAVQLARSLSRGYTAAGGWGEAETVLFAAGYGSATASSTEGSGEADEGHNEALHRDPVRVVIVGVDQRVVRDNFGELALGAPAPDLGGYRETVFDVTSNEPVGYVHVDVQRELLSSESHGFLSTLLVITLTGGVLTAGVAIVVAVWVSGRITAPVTALTEATRSIARGDMTQLPVTSSDELGQMSAAFNRMTSALETQRELRRRLVNDVAHELNTPLSVIQLEAKGLGDGLQTPEGASGHIIEEVERLRGLVTDLESLAETDYGEMRLVREPTAVADLLAAEVARWEPQCRARELALSLEVAAGLPAVDLDAVRMSQALGNLVGNAVRCCEPGGSIAVRAERDAEEALSISVVDDGIGIDAADLPRVFERFYRTDQSRGLGIGGTGLGLAIARAIVEAHGGTIDAASDGPGRGATMTIRLPVEA